MRRLTIIVVVLVTNREGKGCIVSEFGEVNVSLNPLYLII